jgi:hypothetical protein
MHSLVANIGSIMQFQEVFAISLPERTDKRDALTLQSSLSGIALTIMDGVDSSKLHVKALPHVYLSSNAYP